MRFPPRPPPSLPCSPLFPPTSKSSPPVSAMVSTGEQHPILVPSHCFGSRCLRFRNRWVVGWVRDDGVVGVQMVEQQQQQDQCHWELSSSPNALLPLELNLPAGFTPALSRIQFSLQNEFIMSASRALHFVHRVTPTPRNPPPPFHIPSDIKLHLRRPAPCPPTHPQSGACCPSCLQNKGWFHGVADVVPSCAC